MIFKIKILFKNIINFFLFQNYGCKRILFDHLPRCGGTTIAEFLQSVYPQKLTFRILGEHPEISLQKFKNLPQRERHKYRLILGHLAGSVVDYIHPEFLKITVFRNPIDRIISHYYYAKGNPIHYLHLEIIRREIQIETYCSSNLSDELQNWYVTYFSGWDLEKIKANPSLALEKALNNILIKYDIIGFQDNLSQFMKHVTTRTRIHKKFLNEFKNSNIYDRSSIENIDSRTLEVISFYNSLDIALYKHLRALSKNGIVEK